MNVQEAEAWKGKTVEVVTEREGTCTGKVEGVFAPKSAIPQLMVRHGGDWRYLTLEGIKYVRELS